MSTTNPPTGPVPGDPANADFEEIKNALGAGIAGQVANELKQEASKPARLRTRVYTVLAGLVVAAFLTAMWLLWPPEKGAAKKDAKTSTTSAIDRVVKGVTEEPERKLEDPSVKRLQALEAAMKQTSGIADSARSERTAFRAEVKKLLDDDRGRRIAASDDLTARFRVATEDRALADADAVLDGPDPVPLDLIDAESKRVRAERTLTAYKRANLSLQALIRAAAGNTPAKETLSAAVQASREQEELLALEQRVKREKEARDAVARRAAEEAAKKAEKDAEEKRWGGLRPGAVWKGKLALEDETVPFELRVNARFGDKIEGVLGWDYRDRRDEIAFAGDVNAGRVKWKTTRRLKGDPWIGVAYEGRIDGDTIAGTYRYRDGNAMAFSVKLEPSKVGGK